MSFRDDHDAALARAEALERELAREREKLDAQVARLERVERERRRLETELADHLAACADRERAKPIGRPQGDARPTHAGRRHLREGQVLVVSLGLFVLLAAVVPKCPREDERSWEPPPSAKPDCTLTTIPSGARVYAIHEDPVGEPRDSGSYPSTAYETLVGTTPVTRSWFDWSTEGVVGTVRFEARLPGYAPIPVEIPLASEGCSEAVYQFPVADAP